MRDLDIRYHRLQVVLVESRLKMLRHLLEHPNATADELSTVSGIRPSSTNSSVNKLSDIGLVKPDKATKYHYSLDSGGVATFLKDLDEWLAFKPPLIQVQIENTDETAKWLEREGAALTRPITLAIICALASEGVKKRAELLPLLAQAGAIHNAGQMDAAIRTLAATGWVEVIPAASQGDQRALESYQLRQEKRDRVLNTLHAFLNAS